MGGGPHLDGRVLPEAVDHGHLLEQLVDGVIHDAFNKQPVSAAVLHRLLGEFSRPAAHLEPSTSSEVRQVPRWCWASAELTAPRVASARHHRASGCCNACCACS